MSDNIQPGDVVVCVDDSPCTLQEGGTVPCPWQRGQIGRVLSTFQHGIELLPKRHRHTFIAACRFRKVSAADEQFTAELVARIRRHDSVPA